ncbi:MAG: aminotransferase class V-fold PLP-dependent enzyme [Actinomycetota bacterium]|nr:aminotransferase class V-fold PLP-dependent enzyme [Actinomycetota bacterium]
MSSGQPAVDRAVEHARAYHESLPTRPVWARTVYDELLARLPETLQDAPLPAEQVVDELARWADPGLTATGSGRFFGYVIGGVHPAALAADWLTSAWDQNAGLLGLSPAAAAAETVAGRWLLDLLQLPAPASVGFVTGGMMANFTALAAARHRVLDRVGWDVERRGLAGAPPVRVLVGADRHDTVDLAVRYLGLGVDALRVVPADDQGRIEVAELRAELDRGIGPTIVCLQAGEVHTGAFDDFASAIATAHEHGAWVHVDGAFGLWARAGRATRHLAAGVERADSWATDAHKTLNVPYDSGIAIVRDPAAQVAAFGVSSDYLVRGDAPEPLDLVPELSRRARGFPVWAALRAMGRTGVAELVDGLHHGAVRMAEGIAALEGAQVVNDVVFTQVMARFGSDDEVTREVGRRLQAGGTAATTPAAWRGHAVQRISVSNRLTSAADVDVTVAALRDITADLRRG